MCPSAPSHPLYTRLQRFKGTTCLSCSPVSLVSQLLLDPLLRAAWAEGSTRLVAGRRRGRSAGPARSSHPSAVGVFSKLFRFASRSFTAMQTESGACEASGFQERPGPLRAKPGSGAVAGRQGPQSRGYNLHFQLQGIWRNSRSWSGSGPGPAVVVPSLQRVSTRRIPAHGRAPQGCLRAAAGCWGEV